MQYISHDSSLLGEILLSSDGSALTGLWFPGQRYAQRLLHPSAVEDDLPIFAQVKAWLTVYFQGKDPGPIPRLRPEGTPFQRDVWQLLLRIPYGRTTTYKALAAQLAGQRGLRSMSAQAVGGAVGHNPISILVPCHRVIGSDGSLTGYAGGLERKRALLELEGISPSAPV
ncbi:MAG TPA: methylated-DNA--[protein]-cysteine S-methyltransferase [Candidatus Enterenecus stercoripullorum]|nr:methylated-DNA--[protein]-cysteine S-methyltransferase [Candidatus Enterenecus stercoripullorum]